MRRLFCLTTLFLIAVTARGSVLFDQLQQEYHAKGEIELVAGSAEFPVAVVAGQIAGKNVPKSDIDIYLYLFRKELGKYPAELLPLVGLKRVVFCRELSVGGQVRAAFADGENATLYLDVRSAVYSETYRRKVIHHEFYHFIDQASRSTPGDPDWVALNPEGFLYGSAGAAVQGDNKGSLITHPTAGFLDTNALASVVDDKAEIFANLMVNDLKARLLLKQDDLLRTKVQRLKDTLGQFCKQCDEAFWTRVAKQF